MKIFSSIVISLVIFSLEAKAQVPVYDQGLFACQVKSFYILDVNEGEYKEYTSYEDGVEVGDEVFVHYTLPKTMGRQFQIDIEDRKTGKYIWSKALGWKYLNKEISNRNPDYPFARYIEYSTVETKLPFKSTVLDAQIGYNRINLKDTFEELKFEQYDGNKWFLVFKKRRPIWVEKTLKQKGSISEIMSLDCDHVVNNLVRMINSHVELAETATGPWADQD